MNNQTRGAAVKHTTTKPLHTTTNFPQSVSATMSVELTVKSVTCDISWQDLTDGRKLTESHGADNTQSLMQLTADVT